MLKAIIALGLYLAFVVVAVGWRSWFQYRRTKDHGLRLLSGQSSRMEWTAALLLTGGAVLAGAAPLADLARFIAPFAPLAVPWFTSAGLVLGLLGFAGTLMAQLQMGDSWRIGVDNHETTPLIQVGLFRSVRNPIFSSMLLAAAGLLFLVPNALSVAALGSLFAGVEIQVRQVEEPYLARIHGNGFLSYARKVGRFIPRIGCL